MKLTNKQRTKIKTDNIEELPQVKEDIPIRGPSFIRGGVEEIRLSFPNHPIIPTKNAVFGGLTGFEWSLAGLAIVAIVVVILL